MAREKPAILYLSLFSIFICASFIWFWFEVSRSLNSISLATPDLTDLQAVAWPILPLIIGLTFLTVIAILQDVPSWLPWLLGLILSLPIFFLSTPPNSFAVVGLILMFLSTAWVWERIKSEAEDHLKIRIIHLFSAGGIPFLLNIIILVVTLLSLAKITPAINQEGITIPVSLINENSLIVQFIPGFSEIKKLEADLTQEMQGDIEEELKNLPPEAAEKIKSSDFRPEEVRIDSTKLAEIGKQLSVPVDPNDTVYDLLRKNLQQQINKYFGASSSLILLSIGVIIFLSLILLRFPIALLAIFFSLLLFWLLRSSRVIKVEERTTEAQTAYLGRRLDE